MTPKFTAKIHGESALVWSNMLFLPDYEQVRLKRWLKTFKPDDRVDIVIKKHRNKRTDPQNNYYWGVVVYMLSEELGYSKDEMHEALKVKFASKREYLTKNPEAMEEMVRVESTAKMSTERFGEYIEKIKWWAVEYLNLYIPDPNEVAYETTL